MLKANLVDLVLCGLCNKRWPLEMKTSQAGILGPMSSLREKRHYILLCISPLSLSVYSQEIKFTAELRAVNNYFRGKMCNWHANNGR